MKETKSNEMVNFLNNLSALCGGQSRSSALRTETCVSCCGEADEFRDALSEKEFGISGLCQSCQDSVFGA